MKRLLRAPSPALVISLIALFIALGGTSLAATKVITAKHKDAKADTKLVKKLAPTLSVKHAKTANSATTATSATHATSADSATNATNATNATHATSADSATNATNATTATNATQLGGVTASHYVRPGSTLVSGDTETGAYGASASTGGFGVAAITFVPKLSAAPTAAEYVPQGSPTSTCPGPGQAAAGRLCIYEGWIALMTMHCIGSPAAACGAGPTADGAEVYFDSTGTAGNTTGTWTYKAP